MRLLVICPHFEPDTAPTGVVMTAIVDELARAGHDVSVVTALPWYRRHRVEPHWQGRLVRCRTEPAAGRRRRVARVHPFPTDKSSLPARAAGFACFTGLAGLTAMRPGFRPDAVLALAPPITLGLAGWAAARRWRAPLVLNVQDVFPDAAIEVGAIRSPKLIAAARRLERCAYRAADAVTVLSEDQRANVAGKVEARWRTAVRVIPNFSDTRAIRPRERLTRYRAEHGLGERTVVMYAGNVGFSQPLELMVDAARALGHRADAVFVVNGAGAARQALQAAAAGLENLVFADYQPAERLGEVLASADIHVIVLRKGLGRSSVPSKLYSIMAAGRPVVASVDAGTEVSRIVEDAECGLWAPPEDSEAFAAAVGSLLDDPQRRTAMGKRGRAFAESQASAAAAAGAYADLFAELSGSSG